MLLIVLLSLISCSSSLKFLAYSPQWAKSHVNFMAKISDTLVDAGHEVVSSCSVYKYVKRSVQVILSEIFDSTLGGAGTDKARVIEVITYHLENVSIQISDSSIDKSPRGGSVHDYNRSWELLERSATPSMHAGIEGYLQSVWRKLQRLVQFSNCFTDSFLDHILQPEMIARLKAEQFDAAFTESFHFCAPGQLTSFMRSVVHVVSRKIFSIQNSQLSLFQRFSIFSE